ncbi:uncharacterized protein LAESUDRAFT_754689 [Laetiporus sulphureus 93-53]|uniref:Uncharacterized protein n=1 Tax=Laetiporus sulphureus 93-53 TaxID=1314785 RepID=A0A165HUB2_9APHY|nr:uncharacterized protein LAESUDRAFT_754689 [Laetiporus sulphureus 93-53]KZT12196.1 hypothetical protein LAESUDRAFT_754689 [Laetiporus sulphureus 93-53]
MLDEYKKILAQSRNPDDPEDVEIAIVPIMLWSDSTHLAQFGSAALWPIYAFFGFISKYVRAKPNAFMANHLAYIPSLPHIIQDVYQKLYDTAATADVLRFCKRELFHKIWTLILDPEFMHAYEHGILLRCGDGILRHLFPRFFTYSADYPEKVLIACIRYLARCPCPRCLILKNDIAQMGSEVEMHRRAHARTDNSSMHGIIERTRAWVFQKGIALNSKTISHLLNPKSLVTTRSAFSDRLASFGFNHYAMLVPDLMHEFELGVWKAIFTHLLRILYAEGHDRIQTFNKWFRKVPTFGRDTIRRFDVNVSAMKKLAARDYEDILQCIMPVLDLLLPAPHHDIVMDLVFYLATWHALAKLRLHTTRTINIFEQVTTSLCRAACQFLHETCEDYITLELPKEEAARGRRTAVKRTRDGHHTSTTKSQPATKGKVKEVSTGAPVARNIKRLNLKTYKWHALIDYVEAIKSYGTTDNYTTQTGELEHRRVKGFYVRTNKNGHRFLDRNCTIQAMDAGLVDGSGIGTPAPGLTSAGEPILSGAATLNFSMTDSLPFYTPPEDKYHMSKRAPYGKDIGRWLRANRDDPVFKDFLPHLKDHLLSRLTGRPYDGDENAFTVVEHDVLRFESDRIHFYKVLHVNYTTYDIRRAQDSINPRTHPFIMLLAHEDDDEREDGSPDRHPYWYAQVVGIFHFDVIHRGIHSTSFRPQRMDVLWVRWLGVDPDALGLSHHRLPRVGFVHHHEAMPFGFVDPNEVLHGAHLIPAFAYGKTDSLLPKSLVWQPSCKDMDYVNYYVNIHVDRDMFMRHLGGGVGHKGVAPAPSDLELAVALKHGLTVEPPWSTTPSEDEEDGDRHSKAENEEEWELDEGSICDEEDDYGYGATNPEPEDVVGEATQWENEPEQEDLGLEDGEDGDIEDLYAAYGFAML